MKILVAYYSRSGHTKEMARAIAQGVKDQGIECDLRDVSTIKTDDLLNYEALVFGSPTYYGVMAAELKKLIDESVKHHGKLTGKIGGAFSSSGMMGGGGETTILSILEALLIHGMIVVGNANMQHYGPLAVEAPDEKTVETCVQYGAIIATLTKKISAK